MLRSWATAYARALQSFRTTRSKSTSTSSPTSKKHKPLPYTPLNRQRQPHASSTEQQPQGQKASSPWYKSFQGFGFMGLYWTVANAFIIFHLVGTYLVVLNTCIGPSMLPTINYSGDWILMSKLHASMGWIKVGDLVSYKHPVRQGYHGVKRVIGMPGDFVLRDTPGQGDGTMVRVPQGHCWVMGDNVGSSRDSRMFGALPIPLIRSKVIARIWPSPRFFNDALIEFEDPSNDAQD